MDRLHDARSGRPARMDPRANDVQEISWFPEPIAKTPHAPPAKLASIRVRPMCLMHLLNGVNVNNVLMMFLAGALLASSLHARAGGVDPERLLFDADFDAEPLDQPIGTGGPELGQPV
jgi:hypothetical protein